MTGQSGLRPADDNRSTIVDVMRAAGYEVLHRVLGVLDGVAAIADGPNAGTLALPYERDGVATDRTSATDVREGVWRAVGELISAGRSIVRW
jgi:hypothetical protein